MDSTVVINHHGNILDFFTEKDSQYQFFPISCGSVQFKVRAKNDAHLALTTAPETSGSMYEVFIGGWRNTKSVIRRNRQQPDKVEVDTPDFLNGNEYRSFWVRWDNGVISAGRDSNNKPFMTWTDPEPFSVKFVGFSTGWGATGTWQVEDAEEFSTPDKLEYIFRPVTTGYVEVEYRGPRSCSVSLTDDSGNADSTRMYEFILGPESAIRKNREMPDKVTKKTPGLIQPNKFRRFLINWSNGRMTARDADSNPPGAVLTDWVDSEPFPVTHFGVRTPPGVRGHWRIRHFPEPAPGEIKLPPNEDTPGRWVHVTAGMIPEGAVAGGKLSNGEPLYVIRARHKSDILPGKLQLSKGYGSVSWDGAEYPKTKYQVLVGGSDKWVHTSGNNIPPNAFRAGRTEDGEPVFVGRVAFEDNVILGKVHMSHNVCYVPYNGLELAFPEYEILLA